jgi:FMN phosphatase YigB (HAD superfamily)
MPSPEPRAICFDVGGTLVRPVEGTVTARLAMILGRSVRELRSFLENGAKRSRGSCAELAETLATAYSRGDVEVAIRELLRHARAELSTPVVFDDVTDVLVEIRRRGYAIFFLTNVVGAVAPNPEPALYRLADCVFSSCDTGFVKPEREAFAVVEAAARIPGGNILHVGDSLEADVKGARAAGWDAVYLRRGGAAAPGAVTALHELLRRLPERTKDRNALGR